MKVFRVHFPSATTSDSVLSVTDLQLRATAEAAMVPWRFRELFITFCAGTIMIVFCLFLYFLNSCFYSQNAISGKLGTESLKKFESKTKFARNIRHFYFLCSFSVFSKHVLLAKTLFPRFLTIYVLIKNHKNWLLHKNWYASQYAPMCADVRHRRKMNWYASWYAPTKSLA